MFYCNKCAEERDWPETSFKSVGSCEICGKKAECNDLPSSELPEKTGEEVIREQIKEGEVFIGYYNKSIFEEMGWESKRAGEYLEGEGFPVFISEVEFDMVRK